jgi:hypothetical protein
MKVKKQRLYTAICTSKNKKFEVAISTWAKQGKVVWNWDVDTVFKLEKIIDKIEKIIEKVI